MLWGYGVKTHGSIIRSLSIQKYLMAHFDLLNWGFGSFSGITFLSIHNDHLVRCLRSQESRKFLPFLLPVELIARDNYVRGCALCPKALFLSWVVEEWQVVGCWQWRTCMFLKISMVCCRQYLIVPGMWEQTALNTEGNACFHFSIVLLNIWKAKISFKVLNWNYVNIKNVVFDLLAASV